MPVIKTGKKTKKYTTEFKLKAVEWRHQAHRNVKCVKAKIDSWRRVTIGVRIEDVALHTSG
ncbi:MULTISPECIES: hypothetical protein [Marinobacter]|uniref:hypothetical protein n=1 Tax=Marinobacter TaxID=2742 RepID=UPI001107DD28|nr:hypothetical protein [Marinobacter alexandrii]